MIPSRRRPELETLPLRRGTTGPRHGPLGCAIAVASFAVPGAMALGVALFLDLVPAWLQPGGVAPGAARVFVAALGLALLAQGLGFLRFRRWAWWGGLVWAAFSALAVAGNIEVGEGALRAELPLWQLIAVVSVPYLWVRRRDFDHRRRNPT